MEATIQAGSRLKAGNYTTENASVEANTGSTAKVNVRGRLEIKERLGSKVSYRGEPEDLVKE
jgi:hypothetical protein